jgi:hypothetical protein
MAGLLRKTDTLDNQTQLVALVAKNRFFPWLRTDVEVTMGKEGGKLKKAYRTAATLSTKILGTSIDYTYADVGFPVLFLILKDYSALFH